ncbi:hypothetical protein [Paenibacillus farraposensis]|nr:hypothetical protein [Paenibacillus farraposensis]
MFTTGLSLCASGTAFATQTFTGKLGEQQPDSAEQGVTAKLP